MSVDLPQCDPWSLNRVVGISGNVIGTKLFVFHAKVHSLCVGPWKRKQVELEGITKPEAGN